MTVKVTSKLYDNIAMNSGVVLDLPMFEGTGLLVRDISKYHNNGIIYGATWVQEPSGQGTLNLDGTDDVVDLGYNILNQQLSGVTGLTIKFWAKLAVIGGFLFNLLIGGDNSGIYIFTSAATGKLTAGGRSVTADAGQTVTPTTVVSAAVWHFIALILNFTGDTVTTVLDDEATAAAAVFANNTYTPGIPTAGQKETIGAVKTAAGITNESTGQIARPKGIGSILTTAQLANIRNQERSLFGV